MEISGQNDKKTKDRERDENSKGTKFSRGPRVTLPFSERGHEIVGRAPHGGVGGGLSRQQRRGRFTTPGLLAWSWNKGHYGSSTDGESAEKRPKNTTFVLQNSNGSC